MGDKINNGLYYPMLVSQDGTVENMSREEDSSIWRTYMTLSQLKRDILTDQQMPLQIIRLQEQFNLKDQSVGNISLFIRKIFFGELTVEACEAKIGSMLMTTGGGNPNQARAIVEFIQKEILTITPKPRAEEKEDNEEKSGQRTTVNLPLLQALSKYENLGNQLITQARIKVKSQQEPVRPSLLYWLKCYRDELGIGQHDTIERGDFLFRSENCKKLSPKERERVNLILKSIEENLPLSIDTEHQEIIFPVFQGVIAGKFAHVATQTVSKGVDHGVLQNDSDKYTNNDFFKEERKAAPFAVTPSVNNFRNQNQTFFQPVLDDAPTHIATQNVPPTHNSYNNDVSGGGISFSAGHIFPAEKEVIEKKTEVIQKERPLQKTIPIIPIPSKVQMPQPVQNRKAFDDSNPFIIHPSDQEE